MGHLLRRILLLKKTKSEKKPASGGRPLASWEDQCQDCGAIYDMTNGAGLCRYCFSKECVGDRPSAQTCSHIAVLRRVRGAAR
jgi:hypothetical protein